MVACPSFIPDPFVALGLVSEFGSSLLLPRLMGHARAAEKLLLGEPLTPAGAVGCGLATAVVPAAEVLAHPRETAVVLLQSVAPSW